MDRDTLWQLFQRTGLPEAYTLMAQLGQENPDETIHEATSHTQINMGHTSE